MMRVIPAILAHSLEDFRTDLHRVASVSPFVHVDVMDNTLVQNTTISLQDIADHLPSDCSLQLHMMVSDPLSYKESLERIAPKEVMIHCEVINWKECCEELQKIAKVIPVLQVHSSLESLFPLPQHVDEVLLMGVPIGYSGASFMEEILPKITKLKKDNLFVAVDGGINPRTALSCKQAGADILISSSYLLESSDIQKAMHLLENC